MLPGSIFLNKIHVLKLNIMNEEKIIEEYDCSFLPKGVEPWPRPFGFGGSISFNFQCFEMKTVSCEAQRREENKKSVEIRKSIFGSIPLNES